MCNGDENILDKFEANPLLASKEKAHELYDRLNPDDGEEGEGEERKVVRHQKVAKKITKKAVK